MVLLYLTILTSTPLPSINATLSILFILFPPSLLSQHRVRPEAPLHAVDTHSQVLSRGWPPLPPSLLFWNLMVHVLGHNSLFEPMRDIICSMKDSFLLYVSTFASTFSSYCSASKFKKASEERAGRYGDSFPQGDIKKELPARDQVLRQCVGYTCQDRRRDSCVGVVGFDGERQQACPECYHVQHNVSSAYQLLDVMSFHCAFADSLMYSVIFECLMRNRKASKANKFLAELGRMSNFLCLPIVL